MSEIWNPIPGYEKYQASTLGNIKRFDKLLKYTVIDIHGRKKVSLCKNAKSRSFLVARVIASTFIPNPENKPTVNHRNQDPSNDCLSNLEWNTMKEQAANKKVPVGVTGERYITPQYKGYKFQMRHNDTLTQKYFPTLAEAVAFRDEFIASSDSAPQSDAGAAAELPPSPLLSPSNTPSSSPGLSPCIDPSSELS